MNSVMPLTSACASASFDRPVAPGEIDLFLLAPPSPLKRGERQAAARSHPAAVEHHVLARLAQLRPESIVVDASWPALTMPMSMPA
jgi:hypothetical protein